MPRMAKSAKRFKAITALRVLLFLIFCIFSLAASVRLYETWKTNRLNDSLRELKADFFDSAEAWNHELLALNEDYVGWLSVEGTRIDGPVVQGEDNNEYVRMDFYRQYSVAGTFFMDEMVDVKDREGNRIIYGHMMNDNTMFGDLKKYKDLDFFKENNIVCWEDRYGTSYYRLFAAAIVSGSATNTEYMNIQEWAGHLNEAETQEMLEILKERSYLYQDNAFRGENQYIFLVTCEKQQTAWQKQKLVLVGEKISSISIDDVVSETQ